MRSSQVEGALRARPGNRSRRALTGLLVLVGLAAGGCSIGTDPALLDDAAPPPRSDAGQSSNVADAAILEDTIPPIDQRSWTDSALATFALG